MQKYGPEADRLAYSGRGRKSYRALPTKLRPVSMSERRREFLVVGCGPAGATAAREAARAGVETLVLERDAVVGSKRVCAAGLRPGFCETFDVPRSIVHCDTPRLALFDAAGVRARSALSGRGIRARAKSSTERWRRLRRARARRFARGRFSARCDARAGRVVVEYADLRQRRSPQRRRAPRLLRARGDRATRRAGVRDDSAWQRWRDGLLTTLQYRVYLDDAAAAVAYRTLELHYYAARDGRQIVAWMFPKRDHLAIGLGVMGKIGVESLRAELDAFTERVRSAALPGCRRSRR